MLGGEFGEVVVRKGIGACEFSFRMFDYMDGWIF
jgi:hypothetical protein